MHYFHHRVLGPEGYRKIILLRDLSKEELNWASSHFFPEIQSQNPPPQFY
jgi:hypothetical protein